MRREATKWTLAAMVMTAIQPASANEVSAVFGLWAGDALELPECPWIRPADDAGLRRYESVYAESAPCFTQGAERIGQGRPSDGTVQVRFPKGTHEKDYKQVNAVIRAGKVRMLGLFEFSLISADERMAEITGVLGSPARSMQLPTPYVDPPPSAVVTRVEWDKKSDLLVRCDVAMSMQVCLVMPDPLPDDLKPLEEVLVMP